MNETPASPRYEPIALSGESTVVAEFLPDPQDAAATGYQSEAELERALIRQLQAQAYERLPITSEADLITHLRRQLERLNKVTLSDAEWNRFFTASIAGANDGILDQTYGVIQSGSLTPIEFSSGPEGNKLGAVVGFQLIEV